MEYYFRIKNIIPDICNDMGESQKHVEQKNPDTKE